MPFRSHMLKQKLFNMLREFKIKCRLKHFKVSKALRLHDETMLRKFFILFYNGV